MVASCVFVLLAAMAPPYMMPMWSRILIMVCMGVSAYAFAREMTGGDES